MLDSKLVDSIKSLTPAEKAEFTSFLDSRFFQREFSIVQLKQLLVLILEVLSAQQTASLTKIQAHQVVFQDKPYAENRIDRIMYELNRLLKVFWLIKHYLRAENDVQQTLDWSEIQRNKGLEINLERQLQKLKVELDGKKQLSSGTYFEHFQIAKEQHEWQSTFNKAKGDLGLPQAITALDFYYYSERLEMLNRFLLQQRFSSVNTPEILGTSINNFEVPEYYLAQSGVLHITNQIHHLLKDAQPKVEGFQELMQLLEKHECDLKPNLLAQFYAYLRNFCTFLIDAGNAEFNNVLHEIHKDNLSRGYFYFDGKIHPNAFLNITQHAIRADNIPWARQFILSHKDKIIEEHETQEFYRMNEALCLFAEKKYEEALAVIPFGSTNSSYHLMARRLELKIYYELHSEVLSSKIDAFKMFINRTGNKTFSRSLAELFTNFGNFVHQLSLSIQGDKKRSEQLIQRIQAKKLVAERSWLLEKAKELGEAKM